VVGCFGGGQGGVDERADASERVRKWGVFGVRCGGRGGAMGVGGGGAGAV